MNKTTGKVPGSHADGRQVIMTLSSMTYDDSGLLEEPIQLMTTGSIKKSGDSLLLSYQDHLEEDGGKSQASDVVLTMKPGRVQMTRTGIYGTSMVFEKGKRFEGIYHTPYGDMSMGLYATKVVCQADEDQGAIHLEYQMEMQGQEPMMHAMVIRYAGKDPQ